MADLLQRPTREMASEPAGRAHRRVARIASHLSSHALRVTPEAAPLSLWPTATGVARDDDSSSRQRVHVRQLEDLFGNLSSTFQPVDPTKGVGLNPIMLTQCIDAVERDGYIILPKLVDDSTVTSIRSELNALLHQTGRNNFEGIKTQRAYALVGKTRTILPMIDHPLLLGLLKHFLMPNFLLSACQAINIMPGEKAQLLHYDDAFIPIQRPRPAFGAATVWAVDEFTADNGATVIIPGSHKWDHRKPTEEEARDAVPVVMPRGSTVFFLSTLWHGGGANRSNAPRLAFTAQFCQPWLRPQENMCLAVPKEVVRELNPVMQSMLGYSIHPPFIGHVNGLSPLRLLHE